MLSSLFDLITLLVYVQFLDIRWPLNLRAFFDGVEAFMMKSFPNFFTLILPFPDSEMNEDIPKCFNKPIIKQNYLENVGSVLSIFIIWMILYGLCKCIVKYKILGLRFTNIFD